MCAPFPVRSLFFFTLLTLKFLILNCDRPPFCLPVSLGLPVLPADHSLHVQCSTFNHDSPLWSSAFVCEGGLPHSHIGPRHRHVYQRDQLLACKQTVPRACLDPSLISQLKELSIGYRLPRPHRRRGGIRKRHQILTVSSPRSLCHYDQYSGTSSNYPYLETSPTSLQPADRRTRVRENPKNLIVVPLQRADLPNQLCVCQFNARSVVANARKRTAITDFMADHDVDIMFLTETWLRESGDESKCADLTPPGYKLFSLPRQLGPTASSGGGILVIIKECLMSNCTITTSFPFTHTSFEVLELSLTLHNERCCLFCVYRPPPSKRNKLTHSVFYDELPEFLDYCVMKNASLLITGDFNVHYENVCDSRTKHFRSTLELFSLSQAVDEPTFLTSGHTLDLVISRDSDSLLHSVQCYHDLTSDHVCVLCRLSVPKQTPLPKFKSVRPIHKIDQNAFSRDLSDLISSLDSVSDLNTALRRVLDKHAPVCQRRIAQRRPALWYNSVSAVLQLSKRERRRAERRWASSKLIIHKQIYDAAKQKVVDLVHNAKSAFYSAKIAAASSCRDLFHTVNFMIGKTKDMLLPSTHNISDLPNLFLKFFNQKIDTIHGNFPVSASSPCLSPSFTGTTFSEFSEVSVEFVRKLITRSAKTSCDLDPIPTALLCDHLDILLPSITKFINESLVSGTVPSDFKTAVVKPLLKKSSLDHNILKNYRPISNLSFLSKILEKVVLHQLSSHLDSNHLLSPHQSAYRPGHC